jgi:hypothetical protein
VFAAIWSRFFRRAPLEYLLNAAIKPTKHTRQARPGWLAELGDTGGSVAAETVSPVPFVVSTALHSGRRTTGGNTPC